MRHSILVALACLAAFGCAAPDVDTGVNQEEARVFDGSEITDGLMPWVLEGADWVCRDTGFCAAFQSDGPSLFLFAELPRPYMGWHRTVPGINGRVHEVRLSAEFLTWRDVWGDNPAGEPLVRWYTAHELGHAAGLEHVCDDALHILDADYMHSPEAC